MLYTDPTGHFFIDAFLGLGSLFGIGGGAAGGTSAFTSVSAVNNAVATAAVHEARRGIDSVVRNRAYSFNPYRTYLDFERAFLVGPVGFGIDSLTGNHIAEAQQTRVAGYARSSYMVAALAVATFYCGGCGTLGTIPSLGLEIGTQAVLMGATVGSASGLAQAAFTGGDPVQAAALGGLIGAAGGAVGGGIGELARGGLSALLPASMGIEAARAASTAFGLFTGSVAGGTFGGGISAVAGGTNIGQGLAFGALGGAIGGVIQVGPIGDTLSSTLGNAGGFGVYGIKAPVRAFIDGGIDWTSGWLANRVEDN